MSSQPRRHRKTRSPPLFPSQDTIKRRLKYKENFRNIPQNLVAIYFTSEIVDNHKNVVCVILWLFLGTEFFGYSLGDVESPEQGVIREAVDSLFKNKSFPSSDS